MLIKYTRYEDRRKWLHPNFARKIELHLFSLSKGDDFIVQTIENINISDYNSNFNMQILTIQEANDLLVSWNHKQLINEDGTIGENLKYMELKKWNKEKFRLEFSFEERIKFDNYEHFINESDESDTIKSLRIMQMKTIMKDYEECAEFWNTDSHLQEMLQFLESIEFIEEGKANKILFE